MLIVLTEILLNESSKNSKENPLQDWRNPVILNTHHIIKIGVFTYKNVQLTKISTRPINPGSFIPEHTYVTETIEEIKRLLNK